LSIVTVTSAFPAGRADDAAALVFEYMAATQAENGRPVPANIAELPAVLRRECDSLQDVYRRLGYTETEPFETESPDPMIYLQRAVTMSDILSST
jgi:hypothetical protein